MARQTLTMAITLEGADKVEADLAKLGPAAEKAFKKIKDAADKGGAGFDKGITGAVRRFQQQLLLLQAAGQRISRAFGTFRLAADAFGGAIINSARRIGLLAGAIGGAITAVGLFASRTADNAERIDNQAKSLGISAQAYQVFETAAKNAGIEGATFDKIMAKFVTTAAEAGDASGDAARGADDLSKKLREVIITAEDGSQKIIKVRGTSDAFAASIKKVGGVTKGSAEDLVTFSKKATALQNPLERIRAIMAAGFSKREAITASTFFRAIANDADDLARSASRTVGPLSDLEIAIGVRLADAFDRFRTNIFRVKERLVTLFAPAITQMVEHFADLIFNNQKTLEDWANFIKSNAVPIVQDFINALTGNDDAVENKTIIAFRDAVIEFGKAVKFIIFSVIVPAFRFLLRLLDGVAAGINAVFGTNLSGASILATLFVLKIIKAFTLLRATVAVVLATVNLFASAIGVLATPIAGIAAGVAAVVAAGAGLSEVMSRITGISRGLANLVTFGPLGASTGLVLFWSEYKQLALDAFETVKNGAPKVFDTIKRVIANDVKIIGGLFAQIGLTVKPAFDAIGVAARTSLATIGPLATTAFSTVLLAAQQLQAQLAQIWTTISTEAGAIWIGINTAISDGAASVIDTIVPIMESLREQLTSGARSALEAIAAIFSEGGIGAAFLAAEKASFEALWSIISEGGSAAFNALRSAAESVISAIRSAISGLISRVRDAISALKQLASARSEPVQGTGGGAGFAQGGPLRGPGTSTSDSIPLWGSDGEFMIRARAVQKVGPQVLHMINSGRYTLDEIFRRLAGVRIPKFSLGGLIGQASNNLSSRMSHAVAPRFAGGGPVQTRNTSTGRPLTLVVDNQRIDGMTASDDAVQQIMKFTTGKQLRSNGRQPAWR